MKNEELIPKIKAEIERRKKALHCTLFNDEYNDLLRFLSTLESEKPMDGLEDEIKRYLREECSDDDEPGIHELAEHFSQWGAEHLASIGKTSPKDLEEAAEKSLRLAGFHNMETRGMDWKGGFIAGAKWQKEQMMKEAVEGEVMLNPYPTICLDDCKDYDFKDGDKVRIIIVKEDEK